MDWSVTDFRWSDGEMACCFCCVCVRQKVALSRRAGRRQPRQLSEVKRTPRYDRAAGANDP